MPNFWGLRVCFCESPGACLCGLLDWNVGCGPLDHRGDSINNNPRVELGVAALIVVAVIGALVPYSVGLHLNDYRPYTYSYWQATNWAWTIMMISRGAGSPFDDRIDRNLLDRRFPPDPAGIATDYSCRVASPRQSECDASSKPSNTLRQPRSLRPIQRRHETGSAELTPEPQCCVAP